VAWNPNIFELQPFLSVGGILLTGIHIPDKRRISFLNAYGSCSGRRQFWEQVEAKGLLAQDNLILAGDLNFSIAQMKCGARWPYPILWRIFSKIFLLLTSWWM
jgi:hypothetical protein